MLSRFPVFAVNLPVNQHRRHVLFKTVHKSSYTSARLKPHMKLIYGVSAIAHLYDVVLLDQFGVIHDGQQPYPRALEAITRLQEAGVKIIILSNSSRPAHVARGKLEKMGVDVEKVHGIVTSGQIALDTMRKIMPNNPHSRVLHFNWSSSRGGAISLQDHGIHKIANLEVTNRGYNLPSLQKIDFVLAHGTDGITKSDTEIQDTPLDLLRSFCCEIGKNRPEVPFYCANPDLVTVDGPSLRVMPGMLARDFESAGGRNLLRLGKPDAVAYEAAMALVGQAEKSRILAIGDSLGHDILGAANAGIDSLYIAGGINADHFEINSAWGFADDDFSWQFDSSHLENLVDRESPQLLDRRPTFVSSFLRW